MLEQNIIENKLTLWDDIPLAMKTRPFDVIQNWFLKFDIDLYNKILLIANRNTKNIVLDLCCGYGVAAEELARKLKKEKMLKTEVFGVDLKTNINYVCHSFRTKELVSKLIDRNIYWLPFSDNSIDFAYCMAGLSYINDALAVLSEVHRVLQIGKSAYFYLLKGMKDISENITLKELQDNSKGITFNMYSYKTELLEFWNKNNENGQSTEKVPYYLDGTILEIKKDDLVLNWPFLFLEAKNLFIEPKRSFEVHIKTAIYTKG